MWMCADQNDKQNKMVEFTGTHLQNVQKQWEAAENKK